MYAELTLVQCLSLRLLDAMCLFYFLLLAEIIYSRLKLFHKQMYSSVIVLLYQVISFQQILCLVRPYTYLFKLFEKNLQCLVLLFFCFLYCVVSLLRYAWCTVPCCRVGFTILMYACKSHIVQYCCKFYIQANVLFLMESLWWILGMYRKNLEGRKDCNKRLKLNGRQVN